MADLPLEPRPRKGDMTDFRAVIALCKSAPGRETVVEYQVSGRIWRSIRIVEQSFTHEPKVANRDRIGSQRTQHPCNVVDGIKLEGTIDNRRKCRSQLIELKGSERSIDKTCGVSPQHVGKCQDQEAPLVPSR